MLSPSVIASVVLAFHIVGVLAALHAVMTVRTAPGAIAWAGSLVMMPYFTIIPYLIFGRSRFAGYVNARRFNNDRLREIRHGMTAKDPRHWPPAWCCSPSRPACGRCLA